jgi:hypothetical protein
MEQGVLKKQVNDVEYVLYPPGTMDASAGWDELQIRRS